jgi:hypothetical protein
MSKNESTKKQSKKKQVESSITHSNKGHYSKDCPKTQTFTHKVVNDNIPHLGPKNGTSSIKVISSPYDSPRGILVPKHLLTNREGPNKAWVQKPS